mgnify:CR=1 FL=1
MRDLVGRGVVRPDTVASTAASIFSRSPRTRRRAVTRREVVSANYVRRSVMVSCRDANSSAWTWLVSSVSSWN